MVITSNNSKKNIYIYIYIYTDMYYQELMNIQYIYIYIYIYTCTTYRTLGVCKLDWSMVITSNNSKNIYIYIYCMKPPNIKAPKCTLYSFIFQGQRSQGLNGLATAHCEHRWGQLTSESPFRIIESG